MLGLVGLTLSGLNGQGGAAPPPEPPEILADLTFATDTGWTLENPSSAVVAIADGLLKFTGGSGSGLTIASAATSGIAATDTITLQYEVADVNIASPIFAIGQPDMITGSGVVTGDNTVGTHTVELTCQADDTIFRVRSNGTLGSRFIHLDNFEIL